MNKVIIIYILENNIVSGNINKFKKTYPKFKLTYNTGRILDEILESYVFKSRTNNLQTNCSFFVMPCVHFPAGAFLMKKNTKRLENGAPGRGGMTQNKRLGAIILGLPVREAKRYTNSQVRKLFGHRARHPKDLVKFLAGSLTPLFP